MHFNSNVYTLKDGAVVFVLFSEGFYSTVAFAFSDQSHRLYKQCFRPFSSTNNILALALTVFKKHAHEIEMHGFVA